jgi:hypothetical protein
MRENIQLLSFWAWLTSLNMTSSNYIYLPSNHIVSFFLMADKTPLCGGGGGAHTYHIFLIHSPVVGDLGYLRSLAIVNQVLQYTIGVQVSLLYPDLHSFRYVPRNGIAGLYRNSISFIQSVSLFLHRHIILGRTSTTMGSRTSKGKQLCFVLHLRVKNSIFHCFIW